LSKAINPDVGATEAPKETGVLEGIMERLARPNVDIVTKVDGPENGEVDVLEESEI
jgi:hypothetical protein